MDSDDLRSGYDVAIIGGSAAGLSGGLMLGRARRSVVVIDGGAPRNAPADAVHGLFAREATPPAELVARGRAEVRQYGGDLVRGEVDSVTRDGAGFRLVLGDGRETRARRLLVATGVTDVLPDVPGLAERWGRDVVHCPYCHGWEVRDRAIGVLGTSAMAIHQALLFRQLSDDVVLLAHDMPALTADQAEQLAARGIRVVESKATGLWIEGDRLAGVHLADGGTLERQALAVQSRSVARAGFLESLGLAPVEHPSGMGTHLAVEATGRTEAAGVWAAGNVADISAQVGASAAAGALAAAHINADLVEEDTRAAVERHRAGSY